MSRAVLNALNTAVRDRNTEHVHVNFHLLKLCGLFLILIVKPGCLRCKGPKYM